MGGRRMGSGGAEAAKSGDHAEDTNEVCSRDIRANTIPNGDGSFSDDEEKSMILRRALHVGVDDEKQVDDDEGSSGEKLHSTSSQSQEKIQCNLCDSSFEHRRVSASMHLDPCAQEFTPYSLQLHHMTPHFFSMPPPPPPHHLRHHHVMDGAFVQQFVYGTEFNGIAQPFVPIYSAPPDLHQFNYISPRIAAPSAAGVQTEAVPVFQAVRPCYRSYTDPTQLGCDQQSVAVPPPSMGAREHASRALLLSSIPLELNETVLRQELNAWGPVRALQLERRCQGLVTVHYYDLRHAKAALTDIQEQHLLQQRRMQHRYQLLQMQAEDNTKNVAILETPYPSTRGLIGGRAVWAQYAIALDLPLGPDSHNQGTLVIFNLDTDISMDTLRSVFQNYGAVKELRETPKRQHKFVEFFDVRDAGRALAAMDGQDIGGKRVKIEFSRPGGQAARRPRAHPFPPIPPPIVDTDVSNRNPQQHQQQPQQPQTMYVRWNRPERTECTWAPLQSGPVEEMRMSRRQGHSSYVASGGVVGRGCGKSGGSFDGRRRRGGNEKHHHQLVYGAKGCAVGNNGNGRVTCDTIPQFVFDEAEAESNCTKARTTVMIKNIPNKYSQQMLLAMLDQHCVSSNQRITDPNEPLSAYDFVYLPIDFKNKCNLGYAFVNFTSAKATWKLYKSFHMQPWEAFNSRKICEVTYARVQGRSALEDHFRNSRFACDTDEYLPLVFAPPRNGQHVSTPKVVGGHICSQQQSSGVKMEDTHHVEVNSRKLQGPPLLRRHCGNRSSSDNSSTATWNNALGRRSNYRSFTAIASAADATGSSGRVECT